MVTSNIARRGHPSRVFVRAGSQAGLGLLMDSLIMTDNVATIHDSEIDRVIGHFDGLTELNTALRATLTARCPVSEWPTFGQNAATSQNSM